MKRNRRKRGWVYAGLVSAGLVCVTLLAFLSWQPWEFELFAAASVRSEPSDPDSERLFSKGTRVVIVTAHPDDAEFYLGGLLLRLGRAGCRITLVCVTDGDKGYYPFEDAAANRAVRRKEQIEAARYWGAAQVVFLGFPDGRLRVADEVIEAIAQELQRLRPEYVATFDGLYPPRLRHRDHRLTGTAVERALERVHGPEWVLRFATSRPNYAIDITSLWDEKMRLVATHRSQFSGARLERIRSLISSRAEKEGRLFGVPLAEAFRVTRLSDN